MIDLITGLGAQIVWAVLLIGGAVLAFFVQGKRKIAEGRKLERQRAEIARADAKDDAAIVREKAAKKPTEQKRKDVGKWER